MSVPVASSYLTWRRLRERQRSGGSTGRTANQGVATASEPPVQGQSQYAARTSEGACSLQPSIGGQKQIGSPAENTAPSPAPTGDSTRRQERPYWPGLAILVPSEREVAFESRTALSQGTPTSPIGIGTAASTTVGVNAVAAMSVSGKRQGGGSNGAEEANANAAPEAISRGREKPKTRGHGPGLWFSMVLAFLVLLCRPAAGNELGCFDMDQTVANADYFLKLEAGR